MKDPRENTIDLDKHAIWEEDNRVEQRWQWNAMILDYCDMSPEEYMKNPIIEAIKSSGEGTAQEVIDAINSASTVTNDNIDESTQEIVDAIKSGGTPTPDKTQIYYASINSQVDFDTITINDFDSISIIGASIVINYILGDPTEENWQRFLNHEIDEQTLRHLSSNTYYFVIPTEYEGKFIIQENGVSDVTSNFIKKEQTLFDGFTMYVSVDDDYFNEEYPEGITNVKHPHKITIEK